MSNVVVGAHARGTRWHAEVEFACVGGLVADTGSDLLVGLGVTLLALGTAEIVVTALAGTQPEATGPEVGGDPALEAPPEATYNLSPLIMPSGEGEVTYGVTLSILGL